MSVDQSVLETVRDSLKAATGDPYVATYDDYSKGRRCCMYCRANEGDSHHRGCVYDLGKEIVELIRESLTDSSSR